MMKIARLKLFTRRDELPDPRFDFIPVEYLGKIKETRVKLEQVKKYSNDMLVLSTTDKTKIKELRRDLLNRFLYEDGPAGGDTHYLADFSTKDKHWMSKSINSNDRMNYIVYPPTFDENTGILTIRVVIQSLLGHLGPGQKEYSKT